MGKMFLAFPLSFPLSSTLTMMTVVASPMPAPYVEELHVQRRRSRQAPFYPPPDMLYDTLPVQCMPLSLCLSVPRCCLFHSVSGGGGDVISGFPCMTNYSSPPLPSIHDPSIRPSNDASDDR